MSRVQLCECTRSQWDKNLMNEKIALNFCMKIVIISIKYSLVGCTIIEDYSGCKQLHFTLLIYNDKNSNLLSCQCLERIGILCVLNFSRMIVTGSDARGWVSWGGGVCAMPHASGLGGGQQCILVAFEWGITIDHGHGEGNNFPGFFNRVCFFLKIHEITFFGKTH